jgi:hypothetical protein
MWCDGGDKVVRPCSWIDIFFIPSIAMHLSFTGYILHESSGEKPFIVAVRTHVAVVKPCHDRHATPYIHAIYMFKIWRNLWRDCDQGYITADFGDGKIPLPLWHESDHVDHLLITLTMYLNISMHASCTLLRGTTSLYKVNYCAWIQMLDSNVANQRYISSYSPTSFSPNFCAWCTSLFLLPRFKTVSSCWWQARAVVCMGNMTLEGNDKQENTKWILQSFLLATIWRMLILSHPALG